MSKTNISIVLGSGNFGLTLSTFLKIEKQKVFLWGRNIHTSKLYKNRKIYITGQESGVYNIDKVSNNIDEIFDTGSIKRDIYITVPAHVQPQIIALISDKLNKGDTLFLMPGRMLGKFYIEKQLKRKEINVFETQTVFLTCRKMADDKVILYKKKKNVPISCSDEEFKKLPLWMKSFFSPAPSLEIALNNIGMLLHPIPTLFNAGWIENKDFKFKYYKDGISQKIANLIEKVDRERVAIGIKLGVKVISLQDWILSTYNSYGDNLYEVIHNNIDYMEIEAPYSLNHRYIYEDVLTGLVPLESMGVILDVDVKNTTIVIDMLSTFFDYDFRKYGRRIVDREEFERV